MKKIKKLYFYLLGALIVFFLKFVNISSAQSDFYGISIPEPITQKGSTQDPAFVDKASSFISKIISPIFIGVAVLVVVLIGVLVFIKRKRKNA